MSLHSYLAGGTLVANGPIVVNCPVDSLNFCVVILCVVNFAVVKPGKKFNYKCSTQSGELLSPQLKSQPPKA